MTRGTWRMVHGCCIDPMQCDGGKLSEHAHVAHRLLFDVLTHPLVVRKRLPVLLACNKGDAGTKAHTVGVWAGRRLGRWVGVHSWVGVWGCTPGSVGGEHVSLRGVGMPLGMFTCCSLLFRGQPRRE